MSNETTKRLSPLLRKLRGRFADRPARDAANEVGEPVLCALVRALLEWNVGEAAATSAYGRLCTCFVDFNELRVSSHDELAAALNGHPAAADRAARLRSCLGDVYRREHAMSMATLREAPKREARHYLESLDGVPRAVAARVGHEMLEIHAVPVDDRLRDLLEVEGVIEAGSTAEHAATELERAISASDLKEAVGLLLAWADADWTSRVRASIKPAKGVKAVKPAPRASEHAKRARTGAKAASSGASSGGTAKDSPKSARAKSKAPKEAKGASNARGRSAKK